MDIFKLEIKNIRKSFLFWWIILTVCMLLTMAFFPSMKQGVLKELASAKLESFPPAIKAIFGLENLTDFSKMINYSGYLIQYINLAICIFMMLKGTTSLIREETDGTIEYLYEKPVSRTDIVWQKLLANVFCFVVFIAAFYLLTVVAYLAFSDYSLNAAMEEIAIMQGGTLFVGFVFLMAGFFLSTVIKSSKQSASVSMGVVFGTYMLGIMSLLVEKLKFLKYLAPLEWIKANKLVEDGLSLPEWLIGLGVIVISAVAAFQIYRKKDYRV